MATSFEVVISDEESEYARQAAQAVFDEIDRIERLLSRFDPGSDISQINLLKPGDSVLVDVDVFSCLQTALKVDEETGGAFDVTIGPLMNCYRDEAGNPLQPTETVIKEALTRIGMNRLILIGHLDESDQLSQENDNEKSPVTPRYFSVGIASDPESTTESGIEIDLGGIGKGFALDRISEILNDWDITSTLVHGGTSTALAIGSPEQVTGDVPGWRVGVGGEWGKKVGLDTILLHNCALSGSGMEVKGQHIIDPRTGLPAIHHKDAWVCCPSAARADALSTAFMVMSIDEVNIYCDSHPEVSVLIVSQSSEEPTVHKIGQWR